MKSTILSSKQLKLLSLFGILLLLAFSSCRVAFVPKSCAQSIANVHQLQLDVASLYDGYIASEDKKYDEVKYADVTSDIDNIVAYENTRTKAKNLIRQAILVQTMFTQYKADHKTKVLMNALQFKINKKYLLDQIKPLEVSELSLN